MQGYTEPAQSYRQLIWTGAALLVGFASDLALGGGWQHVPGWLGAAVIVLGVHALAVRAARATRSVHLDATTLRVGDDAIGRPEIVGAANGCREPGLPILGWPTGRPKLRGVVTLDLFDGQRVIVPTRAPVRFLAALGVPAPPEPDVAAADGPGVEPTAEPVVRPAEPEDLPLLAEIDERAETIFRVAGYALPRHGVDPGLGAAAVAAAVFVTGWPAVGFAVVAPLDGCAFLEALAVLPGRMREGLGSALVEAACEWGRARGFPAITLTTYAEVPWNAPFYARRGFVAIDDLTPGLAARRARERELGLDAVGVRVVMRRTF